MSEMTINGESKEFREIQEVERHLHNRERWFGVAASPSGEVNVGDSDSMTPFQVISGNDQFGAWLQLLGSGDTPSITGMTLFDPHEMLITDVQRASTIHRLQFAWGASGASALAAGMYTEEMFKPQAAAFISVAIDMHAKRQLATTKVWARSWADSQVSGTVDLFLGIHEYES